MTTLTTRETTQGTLDTGSATKSPSNSLSSSNVTSSTLTYCDPAHLLEQMPSTSFKALAKKVLQRERIASKEATMLLEYPDEEPLRLLADARRQQIAGEMVYYTLTVYIHPTNLCELSCPMCSYYAKPGWSSAWFQTPKQAFEKIKPYLESGAQEVHIVGGLWKETDLPYYEELFSLIKAFRPSVHIKALTPVEYDFLASLHDISVQEVLERMVSFGLDSIPGGGAEILNEEVRRAIAPQKISSERFLEIHGIAHKIGLPTNITMLYGHIEENRHILEHLEKVRVQQDATGGFRTFIPLKYHVENNALGKRSKRLRPKNAFKVYAISRLMLDNIPDIKVLWNYLSPSDAQQALYWGVNDLGSTAFEEKIIKMAGGTELILQAQQLEEIAQGAGRPSQQIHSGHVRTLKSSR